MKEIYLAGGCFWGTEHYLKQIRGVIATETGYAETVHVTYDPEILVFRSCRPSRNSEGFR